MWIKLWQLLDICHNAWLLAQIDRYIISSSLVYTDTSAHDSLRQLTRQGIPTQFNICEKSSVTSLCSAVCMGETEPQLHHRDCAALRIIQKCCQINCTWWLTMTVYKTAVTIISYVTVMITHCGVFDITNNLWQPDWPWQCPNAVKKPRMAKSKIYGKDTEKNTLRF